MTEVSTTQTLTFIVSDDDVGGKEENCEGAIHTGIGSEIVRLETPLQAFKYSANQKVVLADANKLPPRFSNTRALIYVKLASCRNLRTYPKDTLISWDLPE